MKTMIRALIAATFLFATFGVAVAKLPPPAPMTDAQKAAAVEKKTKDAAAAQLANAQLERSYDRSAAHYFAEMKAKGKAVPPPQLGPAAATTASAGKAAPASKSSAAKR